jgi:microcystin-dependent protein
MIDQTSQFFAILTNVGAAKQANADALGLPWKIAQMGVGDANNTDPVPDATQTSLIRERRRAPLNQLSVDPNNSAIIIAEQTIPAEEGGWWIREIGLYDVDGDLVAVANCAPSFKPLLNQGSGRTQVVRINLLVSNSSNVELKIDPSVVLSTREYVDLMRVRILGELATRVTRVEDSRLLTPKDMGLVLINAEKGERNITLPATASVGTADILVQRLDNSGNRLNIRASGTERILFHTHLTPYGYPFFVLMGAGDWWHLRSDGKGKWWLIGRYDNSPLGQIVTETTFSFPPGGYGAANAALLVRTEWPWLWDHAQQSGMLIEDEQSAFKDGCWRTGNSKTTFRLPEIRGEFLRVLDEGRGHDIGRDPGSVQTQDIQGHSHTTPINMDYGGSGAGNAVCGDENRYGMIEYESRSVGGAETRPRNVAFPGRIKII